ncbi:MAG: putative rane protein [Herbinix sp.]|jgi:sporulation integral membrane protein YlbJ|nr:putative rane protein [Herbinix sp.]
MLKISEIQKNKLMKGVILLFMTLMLIFPYDTFQGASTGLLLWFHNVLPNLLPFVILSNLMVQLNITRLLSKVFYPFLGRVFRLSPQGCYPIILGLLSGIPMGAKSTADLMKEQKIPLHEGQFLLGMCNNASPMFILGYIAITQLKLPQIKYALFAIIYSSAILSAVLLRFVMNRKSVTHRVHREPLLHSMELVPKATPQRFTFDLLDHSIMNGFEVVTKIGGYIILFSILAQIIHTLGPDVGFLKALAMGLFEITTGISQICKSNLDINIKIVLVTVLTTFGGFSGIAQTKSVLGNQGLSIKSYIIVKLLSSTIALVLTYLYVILAKL